MRVTAALTRSGGRRGTGKLALCARQEATRGRLAPPRPHAPEDDSGLIVARHGQDGRRRAEFFQRHRPDRVFRSRRADAGAGYRSRQPFFVRVTQAMTRLLQAAHRRRLRVSRRPAAAAGCDHPRPRVAMSTLSALHYYEREGRTLGTRAMIKARPCAGDGAGRRGAGRGDIALRLAQGTLISQHLPTSTT